jgi:hypothetical protein
MKIAQRFNAGIQVWLYQVPKGRLKLRSVGRPFGTYAFGRPHPALKRWAIFGRPSGTSIRFGQDPGDSTRIDYIRLEIRNMKANAE